MEKGVHGLSDLLGKFIESGCKGFGSLSDKEFGVVSDEVRKLRAVRGEMLVKNEAAYRQANLLASETHLGSNEIYNLCLRHNKKTGAGGGWFDDSLCRGVCDFVCRSDMAVPTGEVWHKHVEFVSER